ncbi:MAG: DUF2490 domain-containing protein [Woeseiaceae bacterium]|nr:DUF2490 domain-containing protein [Woeseiaceae bacterium]
MTTQRRVRRLFLGSVSIAMCFSVSSPAAATEHDPGVWAIFSTGDTITGDGTATRWQYAFDAQARYFDIGSGINQWLARPAIGYKLTDNVNAWVGYARLRARNAAGQTADENRYWQQVDWRAGQWRDGQVTMRVRLEQRDVEVGDDVGVVLRFMARYVRPLTGGSNRSLVVGIEPFVDLRDTDWGGDSGLGQNRIYVGLSQPVSDRLTLEYGYMNQYIWRDGRENQVNHLAILNFKVKF